MKVETVANICHEANKVLCESQGDYTQSTWKYCADWVRKSVINGVNFHLDNPDATPEDSHESWLKEKEADGWRYGEEKNSETKEHPCFVAYHDLPESQQTKDYLLKGIIDSLRSFIKR